MGQGIIIWGQIWPYFEHVFLRSLNHLGNLLPFVVHNQFTFLVSSLESQSKLSLRHTKLIVYFIFGYLLL